MFGPYKETPKYLTIGSFAAVLTLVAILNLSYSKGSSNNLGLILVIVIFVVAAGAFMYLQAKGVFMGSKRVGNSNQALLRHWAQSYGFTFSKEFNELKNIDRVSASPGKKFFDAEIMMQSHDDGPFVQGEYHNRKVWVYPIVGKAPTASLSTGSRVFSSWSEGLTSLLNEKNQSREELYLIFQPWCLEVSHKRIPHRVIIKSKKMHGEDWLDTESRSFEDDYDISGIRESEVLQLLDPVMIDLIYKSKADAIEISDGSTVLFHAAHKLTYESLDQMLEFGIQIAQQVERNFPLAKK